MVNVNATQAVAATFTLKAFALTVNVTGAGAGTVASNVGGINCPGTCTATVNVNTPITLTASPASGSAFVGWAGVTGCGTSTTCTVTVVSKVRNQGVTAATTSSTRFYLSADVTRDSSDRLLTGLRTVGLLAPGASSRTNTAVIVPATVPPGTYFVLACADDLGRVAESSETNNCRASTSTVEITQ